MTEHENIAIGGTVPKVSDTHVVALYEPKTGRVAHVHVVQVFDGGRSVTEEEAIQEAKDCAAKAGRPVADLHVKLSKNADHGRAPHRIDPMTREFVAMPLPAPRPKR